MSDVSLDLQTGPPSKPPHSFLGWGGMILLLFMLLCILGGWSVWRFLSVPPEKPGRAVEIEIPRGMSFAALTAQLKSKRVISNERGFALLAYWKGLSGGIQTGRFLVNTGWTPGQILEQLTSGKPLLDRITLPEGLPWWEVGRRLEAGGFVTFADFKAVIHDPAFLRHWGIPFNTAEGFLFPDTYLLMRPLELNQKSARIIAGRLVDTFWRRTASLWPGGKRPGPGGAAHVRRIVTLASIVEKETAVPAERRRVAGVYANRLQKNMLLQADPTIVYGLGTDFNGQILRRHLNDSANTYNTYKYRGLPPGPICSPGLASLRAAANPETHNFLYFVARGDGSHTFSKTLTEHNRAVSVYRATLREGDTPALMPGGVGKTSPSSPDGD